MWNNLPEVVLAKIFCYLGPFDKLSASSTCQHWNHAICRPEVWTDLKLSEAADVDDNSPSDREENESFIQQLTTCIENFGRYFQNVKVTVDFKCVTVDILESLSKSCKNVESFALFLNTKRSTNDAIRPLLLEFCRQNTKLRRVMIEDVKFSGLKNASLPIGLNHSQHLQELWIVNSFRLCSLSNLMYLVNLTDLGINPNHMNFSLLRHLASCSLKKLYIVSNCKTKEFYNEALSDAHWQEIRNCGPKLKVHCFLAVSDEWSEKEVLLKPSIPMVSLVYRKSVWLRNFKEMSSILCKYGDTLEDFADFCYNDGPYRHPTENDYRIDKYVVDIVRFCPKLKTLVTKEALSSATLLLLAHERRDLANLVIREDMVKYESEIPSVTICDVQTKTFIDQNYHKEHFCRAMTALFGRVWHPLSKREYYEFIQNRYKHFLYNTDRYYETSI